VPKVGNQTFTTIGLQLSKLEVGNLEQCTFGLQLLVSKVGTWDFFAKENFLEQKIMS
jgi:hypothetical protein